MNLVYYLQNIYIGSFFYDLIICWFAHVMLLCSMFLSFKRKFLRKSYLFFKIGWIGVFISLLSRIYTIYVICSTTEPASGHKAYICSYETWHFLYLLIIPLMLSWHSYKYIITKGKFLGTRQ